MIDTEEKQVLDRARKDENYRELIEEKDNDGIVGPVQEQAVEQFFSVTAAMRSAMQDVPDINFQQELDTPEYYALKALYTAKTGRDMETGVNVSGMARNHLLNQALIYLQPVLAVGLRPDFKQGRTIYNQLVVQINEVRSAIETSIKVQNYIVIPEAKKDKAEAGDTGDDGDGGGAGEDADDENEDDADEDDAQKKPKKRSLWQRLTGGGATQKDKESDS